MRKKEQERLIWRKKGPGQEGPNSTNRSPQQDMMQRERHPGECAKRRTPQSQASSIGAECKMGGTEKNMDGQAKKQQRQAAV